MTVIGAVTLTRTRTYAANGEYWIIESAKFVLYVLKTCSCANVPGVPTCFACFFVQVSMCLQFLRASRVNMLWVLMNLRVNMSCELTCSRANMSSVHCLYGLRDHRITSQQASFDAAFFSFAVIVAEVGQTMVMFKNLITVFPQ